MAEHYIYPGGAKYGFKFFPMETIQKDVENNLPLLLNKPPGKITTIVIVGAWHGDEVTSFLRLPNANIYCFEPDPSSFAYLRNRFEGTERVTCYPYACGSQNSEQTFYSTDREGNGSLLKPLPSLGVQVVAERTIRTIRLDSLPELQNRHIDLLWADVQGYELEVLKGMGSLLGQCDALFLEVGEDIHYEQAVSYQALQKFVADKGFVVAAERAGGEFGGNVLFMPAGTDTSKIFKNVPERIKSYVRKEYLRRKLNSFGIAKILPDSFKLRIKRLIGW